MAANNQSENNDLKKRFDNFHREARFQSKPYRLLGRPQIANKHVSVLIGYPTFENPADKAGFTEGLGKQLEEYGLDLAETTRQKSGLRILARLRVNSPTEESSETK